MNSYTLGELLTESKEVAEVDPNLEYKQVKVRLWGKGVSLRQEIYGKNIKTFPQFLVKENQFIYGKQNFFRGACGIVPEELEGAISTSDIPVFDINQGIVLPEFLEMYFKQEHVWKLLETRARGAASRRVHFKDIKDIEIKIPSISEQEKFITKYQNFVELYEQLKQEKRNIQNKIEQIELSFIEIFLFNSNDKLWNKLILKDIVDLQSGKGFKANEYSINGVRLFQIANVSIGKSKWEEIKYLPEKYLETHKNLVLQEGDLIMALNRPLLKNKLKITLLKKEDVPSILYQRVGRFIHLKENTILNKYLFYYFNSNYFISLLNENLRGADQPFINKTNLMKFPLSFPKSIKEQQKIVNKLDKISDKLKILKEEEQRLDELIEMLPKSVLSTIFN